MTDLSRRAALTAALAGPALALGDTSARADQPHSLRGTVDGDAVELPKLHEDSEVEGPTTNFDPLTRRLGVAIVGLGHLAIDQILPGTLTSKHIRVTALVSGDPAKARAIAAQYNVPDRNLYSYDNFDQIKDNPAIDFVYIVLPNNMHEEYTIRAARAGKHVLCEKPMATAPDQAERMIAACRQAGRLLMVTYRLQYNPYHRALVRMARSGEYGPIRAITAVNGQNDRPDGQWRQVLKQAGGGSLPDVGLYCLSAARYITGEEPIEITAQLTQPKDDPRFREVEDIAAFTLRFPSGVLATCMSGYSHHDTRTLSVMLAKATISMDPAFGYEGLQLQIARKIDGAASIDHRHHPDKNQFATEMDHFADCIRANRTPHTPGEEGLQDQRLIAAIYQAAQAGTPVKIPPVAGQDTTRGPSPVE